jgi:hypothetical protein
MSDKEQPNKISVKTATITESHEHESSVTEAVDGIKAKDSDSNKRKLQDRGSTSDDLSIVVVRNSLVTIVLNFVVRSSTVTV